MSIERLQSMSTIFYIIAVVLLFIAIALFFLLDIRRIIGDLTGITARKAIEDIRRQNENTGEKIISQVLLMLQEEGLQIKYHHLVN